MADKAKSKLPIVVTPECRLSFPSLFKKRKYDEDADGDGKFEVTMLFNKKTNLTQLRKVIEAEAVKKFGTTKGVKLPVLDGDNKGGEIGETYAGHFYAHAKSIYPVAVVDRDRNELTEEDVYAGCYVKASVAVKADEYKENGKVKSRYVKLLLRAVMKTRDGEPFSKVGNAAEDFENEGADDESNYEADESSEDALDLSEFGIS